MTRGQLAKVIALACSYPLPPLGTQTFADVPVSQPFYPFIETAYAHNIISGYTCGGPGEPCDPLGRPYFRPGNDVTRGQLSKMISTAEGWTPLNPPSPTFADVPPSHPFYGFVEAAVARAIISGYTCGGPGEPCDPQSRPYFRAGNSATRAQLSKMIYLAITGRPTPTPTATRTAVMTHTPTVAATATATRTATPGAGGTATVTRTPTTAPATATRTITPTVTPGVGKPFK